MKDEVVKYHNKLNTISMRRWTAEEMNFFFSVIAKVRNKGTRFYKPKNSISNVPDWVEKEYKHSATAEEQAKLEELKRSMFED